MRMLFMGRKATGAMALEWSIQAGFEVVGVLTDSSLPNSPVRDAARRFRVPLYDYQEAADAVAAGGLKFDVGVSFVYSRRIKEPLLSQPPYGIINFHPAPLPDYKGTAGYNVAILEALPKWAVTAHYVDETIDTGRIIERLEFDIDPDKETVQSLERRSQGLMLQLYKKILRRVQDQLVLDTWPNTGGRYITRREMEEMKEVGCHDDVDRKIRAFWFPPYTGACITIGDTRYTLVNTDLLEEIAELYRRS